MKTCTNINCKEINPQTLENFSKNKNHPNGYSYYCKHCSYHITKEWRHNNMDKVRMTQRNHYKNNNEKIRNWAKEYRIKNPGKEKNKDLMSDFNITLDQYNQMLKEQNDSCAICKQHKSNFKLSLAVDHCHKTNKIRGLLCSNCNTGLGKFKDDIKLISIAIKYLEKKEK